MSGTRLNTKIEDLAASLTVVTKQQLMDTAAVDINDVFLYEANTEGTKQWTSFANDRGTLSDDVQANPTAATRMRGLSAANTAANGFTSSLPFDSYNVDSIEISRGPNSTVFGLGNTGGGVNVNLSKANLTREITTVGTRGDSFGGYRATFDINRPLLKDHVAIRVLGLYDNKGFVLEPSYEKIRRMTVALTVRPFKNSTFHASFESYRDYFDRPNSVTPRDGVSDWMASGKPTYDPITATVHFADGRPSIGPITTANENAQLPGTIAPSDTAFTQTPSMYIANGGQIQLYEINDMPTATGTGPTSLNTAGLHLLQSTSYFGRFSTQNPLSLTQGVTNKAIYDWSKINIGAPNFGATKGETSTIDFSQYILNTPRQTLAFQAGWFGERTYTNNRSFLGSYGNNGGKFQIYVDINEKLLDGSTNPYFLQPYLGYSSPRYKKTNSATDNYRANLAYDLDLTKEKGMLKWLGRNRFSFYGEYRSMLTSDLSYSDTIGSDESWMSTSGVPSSRTSNTYKVYMHYLLGDANGFNVDYGPKGIVAPPLSVPLRYYNGVTQQWVNEPVDIVEYYGANRPNRRLLSTYGGTWQGSFLDDRIVPLFGVRKDYNRTRDANSAVSPTTASDGYYVGPIPAAWTAYDWVADRGKTTTEGGVVKALPWMHLLYTRSTSFSPGALNYDVLGQPLPDPRGKTRDYGFEFIFLNDRLHIRAHQYETLDIGRADSTINTYVQRTLRMDGGPNAPVSYPVSSSDPNLTAWYGNELAQLHPTWTADQITAEVIKQVGVDPTFISSHYGKTHGDRSNATSRGKEIEITFNPNRFWTIKSTITQTKAYNAQLSPELQDYIFNDRMPTWTTIKGPYTGNLWWTSIVSGTTTPQTFYTANVLAPLKVAIATQGKQRTQTREWHYNITTNYKLAGITSNRWLKNMDVGGAFIWEDKASIGYYGMPADPDGIVRDFDPNRPIWDRSRYIINLHAGYNLRMYNDKVRARIQLNVNDIFAQQRLQAVAVNPDGTSYAFRIVDPRQFILSVNFDL
jgi:hypothetical protein